MPPKLFSFTHFRKNASATPLVSHTFKTKDLKPFRFTHFQKKGGGRGVLSNLQPHTSNLCSPLTPLDSALTSKRASKSFTSNTYEKHTQGERVATIQPRTSNFRSSPRAFLGDSFRRHASNRRIQQFHHVQDGQRVPVTLQPRGNLQQATGI